MFLIIGGVGLLGCLAGIAWMVVSYIKNKSFVLPVILFLLFFSLMGGGIFLEAAGGNPFGGEPAEDLPPADSLSAAPDLPETGGEPEAVSPDKPQGLAEPPQEEPSGENPEENASTAAVTEAAQKPVSEPANSTSKKSSQTASAKPPKEASGSQSDSQGPLLPPSETGKSPSDTDDAEQNEGPQLPPDSNE